MKTKGKYIYFILLLNCSRISIFKSQKKKNAKEAESEARANLRLNGVCGGRGEREESGGGGDLRKINIRYLPLHT